MASEQHEDPPGQIVVCVHAEAVSAIAPGGAAVDDRGDELQELLGEGARLLPLFAESQARLRQHADDARGRHGPGIPDLSRFYRVEIDDEATRRSPEALLERLQGSYLVEAAYFKHRHELAELAQPRTAPDAESGLPTPDFTESQGYLGPASAGGIDARYAWSGPGGTGEGVEIIDIENAWRFTHEDLVQNQGGVLNTAPDDRAARNHGTAVAGILSGDANTFGITGICPGARISGISVDGEPGGSAGAIRRAADRLHPGDIVLIEDHSFGPVTLEQARSARSSKRTVGFVPIDIWPDDFAAVKYATDRGIIVVAAAGNGGRHLDEVDDLLRVGGSAPWANPFDREEADSGAIFVGAGAAPGGDHPDRSRLHFSNWGSCVDAQGWGERIVTTGGVGDGEGDLQGGPYEDRWYTRTFGGTSGAAPMVAGALACVQGVLRAEGLPPLSPRQARALLRVTGSPQAAEAQGPLKRIGQRPNLRELIPRAMMFVGGADFLGDVGDPGPYGGMNVSIVFGDCGGGGGGWGSPWGGPHWRGPHWRGPHWRGPHWRGPHWRGPHWRGPGWYEPDPAGPVDLADPFGAGGPVSAMEAGGRREIRMPGFSG